MATKRQARDNMIFGAIATLTQVGLTIMLKGNAAGNAVGWTLAALWFGYVIYWAWQLEKADTK